ncbi:hypothetical protein [Roseivirga pacifica]|uniref:hypothetical protein n=1 Tax=Roseivirga pacifica TaxID=1267423 RepID=UPI003BB00E41
MRSTFCIDETDVQQKFITYPAIFATKESFQDWRTHFYNVSNHNSHWLGDKVSQELMYIQNYVVNLDRRIDQTPSDNYIALGIILKKDFTTMASNLEKEVLQYFDKGWKNLRVNSKPNKQLSDKVSINRLNNSNLMKRHLEISKFLKKKNSRTPKSDVNEFTELFNIAPNGMKTDIVYIKEVPNIDNSGVEYELSYCDYEYSGKPQRFGHCELIMGNIMFDDIDSGAKTLGVSNEAIKLLSKWIDEHIEEDYD